MSLDKCQVSTGVLADSVTHTSEHIYVHRRFARFTDVVHTVPSSWEREQMRRSRAVESDLDDENNARIPRL